MQFGKTFTTDNSLGSVEKQLNQYLSVNQDVKIDDISYSTSNGEHLFVVFSVVDDNKVLNEG